MNKKKIIFFDGDGTLWYPIKTKRKEAPHWIYLDKQMKKNYKKYLVLTPTTLFTLKKLSKIGIITILLSTHPQKPREANLILKNKVKHFKINNLFNKIYATKPYHESKGEFIINILKKLKISKNQALMVGDSYDWDYKPAKNVGIDALLIESDYRMKHKNGRDVKNIIKNLKDVLKYV